MRRFWLRGEPYAKELERMGLPRGGVGVEIEFVPAFADTYSVLGQGAEVFEHAAETVDRIVILGVAGLAVGVDQLFLGEATAAGQAQAGVGGLRLRRIAPSTPAESALGGPGLSVTATPFPAKLPALDESDPVRDLFSLTDEVRTLLLGSTADDTGSESSDGGSSGQRHAYRTVEGFTQRHRLEAVIVSGSRIGAVVDGAWVEVGRSIDECLLLRVEGRTAVSQCVDGEAKIAVGGDSPLGPATW